MQIKLFQVTETDLAFLESELPRLLDCAYSTCNDDLTRKRWQMVKETLSNIRWNYGPPKNIERIEPTP